MSRRQASLGIGRGLFAGRKGRRLKENLLGYLYILPATIILAAFHFLPVGYAFYISLHNRCTWWTWSPAWPGCWALPRPKGFTAAFCRRCYTLSSQLPYVG